MTNNKTKGFLLGAIAAASYGMNPLFTLPLYSAGMSVDSVLFYRYALAIVVLGIMMKMQKQSFAIKKADVLPLCIMGLLFSFSSLFLFMSYNYMDAGIASTILFVYPVLVAIIMAVVFKEKVSPVTMFSIALAFVGISLLCKSPGGQTLSLGRDYFVSFYPVLCYLYSWRKPFFPEGYAYSQAYLCPAFRPVCLCGAIEVLYRIAAHPYTLVMGERSFTGCFSCCYFVGDLVTKPYLWFHHDSVSFHCYSQVLLSCYSGLLTTG